MRYVLFLLLFITFNSDAAIYQQQDPQGNITYSDVPLSGSKTVTQPQSNTSTITQTPSTPNVSLKKPTTPNANSVYNNFSISIPQDQATIQNQPEFTVKLALEPSLQNGDKIQVILDGQPWGTPEASTAINMPLVDRGSHQLSARIIDKNQQVIKETQTITIYVHHASALNKPAVIH